MINFVFLTLNLQKKLFVKMIDSFVTMATTEKYFELLLIFLKMTFDSVIAIV